MFWLLVKVVVTQDDTKMSCSLLVMSSHQPALSDEAGQTSRWYVLVWARVQQDVLFNFLSVLDDSKMNEYSLIDPPVTDLYLYQVKYLNGGFLTNQRSQSWSC